MTASGKTAKNGVLQPFFAVLQWTACIFLKKRAWILDCHPKNNIPGRAAQIATITLILWTISLRVFCMGQFHKTTPLRRFSREERLIIMGTFMRSVRRASLIFFAILISTSALVAGLITTKPPTAMAAPAALPNGATLPYVELEAENATINGTIIGPDRTRWTLAGESQGRRAVTLSATGQYVQFTLPAAANSMVIRYSMPDSADGTVATAHLSLYINGTRQTDLSLTSKYAWQYGGYPFNNVVSGGNAHRFYDESRFILPSMAVGTTVKLQKASKIAATTYTTDFEDFEQISPALPNPGGSTSVVSNGAEPRGVNDSPAAIQNTVNAGGTIWFPAGTYKMGHIDIGANNITIKGAGMWYTTIKGLHASFAAPDGIARDNIHISDLSIFGENTYRIDSDRDEAIAGSWTNSGFSNIWSEHTKSGFLPNGATNTTTFSGWRNRDTYADGVNLWAGVQHTTVTQSSIRNTGDDGMAMFSNGAAGHDNTFSYNTVGMPSIANNIGVYGGYNNTVSNNLLMDTLWNGDGIQIANRFGAVAMTGTTTVTGNTLLRTGSYQYDKGWPAAAILFFAEDSNMTATVNLSNNQIIDSTYAAINFAGSNITNVNFNASNNILGAGTYGVQIQTAGSASFTSLTASQLGVGGTYQCGTNFTITQGTGDPRWESIPVCPGTWPNPVYNTNLFPAGYTYCANENETCSFNGVASVAYGANGAFNYGTFSNSAACTNATFGDPAPGVAKTCSYKFTNGPTPTPCATCPANTNTPPPSNTPSNPPTPSPIPGTVVRAINAGGAATGNWVADTGFDSGNVFEDTSAAIDTTGWLDTNIAPQIVYQNVRWNTAFTYTVTGLTANSSYVVLLHFAELSLNAVGARKFNVAINGTSVLSAFDVVAAAGFKHAVGKAFNATPNGSGNIVIAFTNGGADNPMVNGIEIIQQSGATPTNTPVPPTATPTKTNTPVGPTNTPTRTNTPAALTNTPTRTKTPASGRSAYPSGVPS